MDTELFDGKTVLVMGLGRFGGGLDSALFAARYAKKVTVTDLADAGKLAPSLEPLQSRDNIELHLGRHDEDDFHNTDIVIVNPAVPPDNPYLAIAHENGAVISSQMNLFFALCRGTIVGITGSAGKSTTTALALHLLKSAVGKPNAMYKNVHLGGNIGNEPLLEKLERIDLGDIVVLELSSFQIEQLASQKQAPFIALVTNLLPNHLDRYGTFEKYCDAKKLLFEHQPFDSVSIFNADDPIAYRWHRDFSQQKTRTCLTYSATDVPAKVTEHYHLPGEANLSNLAAARAIVSQLGLTDEDIASCLSSFKALSDRLELVAEINGVRWYNDSKATTPESTIVALQSFTQPIVLIAGGYDKHLPFDELGKIIAEKTHTIILLGATAPKIADCLGQNSQTVVHFAEKLPAAVQTAAELARPGDVVLLSPACASYDMFENYQQRGQVFRQAVHNLEKTL